MHAPHWGGETVVVQFNVDYKLLFLKCETSEKLNERKSIISIGEFAESNDDVVSFSVV